MACAHTSKDTCTITKLDHQDTFQPFHDNTFNSYIYGDTLHLYYIMNFTDYWPLAREHFIWNMMVAASQFWTADLESHILSSAIEQVHAAFFYTTSIHLLYNQPEEVLFSHFMTTLNTAFESKLALENKRYESGSENFNIPTPLQRTSRIHHVSSKENISFDPSTPCTTATSQSNYKPVHPRLSFNSSDAECASAVHNPYHISTAIPKKSMSFTQQSLTKPIYYDNLEEEEDFQTVELNDNHWNTEPVPDRCLCIHEHSLSHLLCAYPCLYHQQHDNTDYAPASDHNVLDLSDISDFEDVMTTSSDEDIPALDDVIGL